MNMLIYRMNYTRIKVQHDLKAKGIKSFNKEKERVYFCKHCCIGSPWKLGLTAKMIHQFYSVTKVINLNVCETSVYQLMFMEH